MGDYEQMEIDVRLESEKSLKDNLQKVVQFTYDKRRLEAEEAGYPLHQVSNKHEGYGIAVEAFSKVCAREKTLKGGMADYLSLLQTTGEKGIQICGDIYSYALDLAIEAVGMAADATRILNDLYYDNDNRTPLEQLIEEPEEGAGDPEEDDFEDTDADDEEAEDPEEDDGQEGV